MASTLFDKCRRSFIFTGSLPASAIASAVRPGADLLRLCPMATHTDEQIDSIISAFAKAGRTLGEI